MSAPAVRRWPYILPLAIIALLFALFGKRLIDVEHGRDPNLIPSVLLNTPMPEFALAGLPGRGDGLKTAGLKTTDLKGRVSLVNVWGSWCVACLQEHPTLIAIAKEGAVPIHGIAWRDSPERSLTWLREHGDPYALVGQDPDSRVAISLGVTGAPETFVVDAEGVIRYKQIGPITPEVWRTTLAPLIARLRP
jgi:cytochrome c biogenesis protein CcmG/thiol:disulfide interchange protein DsbE